MASAPAHRTRSANAKRLHRELNGSSRDECLNEHWFERCSKLGRPLRLGARLQRNPAHSSCKRYAAGPFRSAASFATAADAAQPTTEGILYLEPDFLRSIGTPTGGRSGGREQSVDGHLSDVHLRIDGHQRQRHVSGCGPELAQQDQAQVHAAAAPAMVLECAGPGYRFPRSRSATG